MLVGLAIATVLGLWAAPPAVRAQAVDVYINVTGGGSKKLNIAIPEFTVVAGTDTGGVAKLLASVAGNDLTLSGFFSVVAGGAPPPPHNPQGLREGWAEAPPPRGHPRGHGVPGGPGERRQAGEWPSQLTTPAPRRGAATKLVTPSPRT